MKTELEINARINSINKLIVEINLELDEATSDITRLSEELNELIIRKDVLTWVLNYSFVDTITTDSYSL